jgi:hypothetical protein
MTSFVQPLDAGIIQCFKAHYRHAFCIRAIDLDAAGEDDIYGINLLKIMHMARRSWMQSVKIRSRTAGSTLCQGFAKFERSMKLFVLLYTVLDSQCHP